MKQSRRFRQIITLLISVVVILSCALLVQGAKENFRTCEHIGIRNCTAPVAGNHPDYDVTAYSPGQYEIMSVNWFKGSVAAMNSVGSTETFEFDTVYIAEFEVWAKDAYTFTTDSNGYTTVRADVGSGTGNGEYAATVWNVSGEDNTKRLTVRVTFPATARNVTIVNKVEITDVVEPYAGDTPSYASSVSSVGNAAWTRNIDWYSGGHCMSPSEKFVEGERYTVQITLNLKFGYEFATDPNHFLSRPGYPFTAVTGTINGQTATVLPDNDKDSAVKLIVVAATFTCQPSRQITHVDITDVTEPKTGEEPKYFVRCGDSSYDRHNLSNFMYAYGVAWLDNKENPMRRNEDLFKPSTVYTISITLVPTGHYVFAADEYDRPLVTATVNGKEAEVHKSSIAEGCIEVTYKFRRTDSLEITKVEVNDIDPPKDGELADYTMSLGDTTYAPYYKNDDDVTKNSILWLDTTTNQYMRVGVDKFVGGHEYSLIVVLGTTGDYTFQYVPDTDSYTVSAKINGKTAQIEECVEDLVNIYYDFTCEKVVHVCTLQKVEKVKATCTAEGKEEHYFCSECGKFFEDKDGKKEIRNLTVWGIIEAEGHTGGKATCKDKAICKTCGAPYGELEGHKYGSGWDYKDAVGHAHKCTVCGAPDTVVAHVGGDAKCGQLTKCTECKMEFGEVIQHQWSTTWEYTDTKGHAHKCTVCGEHDTVQEHAGGTADCKNKAKCAACGTEYGKTGDHVWSTAWDYTDTKGHAHKCTVAGCSEHSSTEKHVPGEEATESSSQLCTACGYTVKAAKDHKHDLTKVKEVDATCTEDGCKQHYTCSGCDAIFSDSRGKEEIERADDLVIPATNHSKTKWKTNSDSHWQVCAARGCGEEIEDSKGEHVFDDDNKCTVCGYNKKTGVIETEEEEIDEVETDKDESDKNETDAPAQPDETKDPADKTDEDKADTVNKTWLFVGGALLLGVVCLVIVTVILMKNNKRK